MAKAVFEFDLLGTPVPQGSKTPGVTKAGNAFMRESGGERHRIWRRVVRDMAKQQRAFQDGIRFSGPVKAEVTFRFVLPLSADIWDRERGWRPHIVRPDVDKLIRSIFDSLTDSKVISDDCIVWDMRVRKIQVHKRIAQPGITVRLIGNPDTTE